MLFEITDPNYSGNIISINSQQTMDYDFKMLRSAHDLVDFLYQC